MRIIPETGNRPEPSPFALPQRADVVIIGAGIMGCATAYYLAKQGIKAVVLDKSRIAGQQSTRAWGFVRQQGRDPSEMPLAIASNRLWLDLQGELQTDLGWRQGGCLYVGHDARQMAHYEACLETSRQHGVDTRLLSANDVRALLPGFEAVQVGGLYTPSDGQAEPRLVAPAFARKAADLGARFVEGCGLTGIEVASGKVVAARTERGEIRSDHIICTAGAASWRVLRSLGIALPQHQVRGTVARTSSGPAVSAVACIGGGIGWRQRSDGSFNLANDARVDVDVTLGHLRALEWYMGPLLQHYRSFNFKLNGAFLDDIRQRLPKSETRKNGHPVGVRDPLLPANDADMRACLARLKGALPSQRNIQIVERWAGGIDVLPDGIPVLDAPTTPSGLMIATGFCGHGFALGPIVGKTLADWLTTGQPGINLHDLRLSRYAERDVKPPHSLF
ncbi:FAD-binding oxidoreductase [Ensifer sp. ENS12]|uniref:NAD(P)/FAD-dependent oxidoreductase n=1 Tax=Ensifer sp. ENS12 TaxID=2854774 RepID=UPI001C4781F0|nr:FAD-binding oxidoreductase [Ensifer sp. ENS12]MBV7522185.1 FAD-binding oxidoreductase [Ensifer sp. ENS12]